MQLLDHVVNLFRIIEQFRRMPLRFLDELRHVHSKYCEGLPGAVVQFACHMPAFCILRMQQALREQAQQLGLPQYLGAAVFKLASASLDLFFQ